jgi:hypothetical protein
LSSPHSVTLGHPALVWGANDMSQWSAVLERCLQAFRRFQWVPVRVEVELRKLQHQRPDLGQLVPPPSPDRGDATPSDVRDLLGNEDP